MPVFTFSSRNDAEYFRARATEMMRLYHKPRRWLSINQAITLNIYAEPGILTTGTDGVTSIPANRQFTSAGSNFTTLGLSIGDVIEIFKVSINDVENGRYKVTSVTNATTCVVDRDWPTGSKTALNFTIYYGDERFTETAQPIPFSCKLEPPIDELTKWGIEEKRDALIVLSVDLCNQLAFIPKIGDRFLYDHIYADDQAVRSIHYEVKDMLLRDQLGDSGLGLFYVGGAIKCRDQIGV